MCDEKMDADYYLMGGWDVRELGRGRWLLQE